MVKLYVHAKFCPNPMNGIQIQSQNVICGVKFILFGLPRKYAKCVILFTGSDLAYIHGMVIW